MLKMQIHEKPQVVMDARRPFIMHALYIYLIYLY